MSPVAITLLVIVIVLAIIIAVLYFLGKKAQKKQAEQQELLDANKQTVSMLIIDKKRMKMKDAGLPQMVIDQTPKMMRGSKLPIIKAKVGPQIVSLICDEKIFESVPVKKEVKAVVSGIYVLDVKGLHGKTEAAPEKKKQSLSSKTNDSKPLKNSRYEHLLFFLHRIPNRYCFSLIYSFKQLSLKGSPSWSRIYSTVTQIRSFCSSTCTLRVSIPSNSCP